MTAPPAPWDLVAQALVWVAPARSGPGVVTGMFVSYESTPVGPYDEVLAAVAVRRGARVLGHVPFIAVDSQESVDGGRANWFLPKHLAVFEGRPGDMVGRTGAWEVRARTRTRGPAFTLPVRGGLVQVRPDGEEVRVRVTGRARARPALVAVAVSGEPAGWLRSGRYPGVLLEHAEAHFGEARLTSGAPATLHEA